MTSRTAFYEARRLYRVSEADPGYDYDNRLTISGRNPMAYGHVNPTRDRAYVAASKADPRAVSFLARRIDAPLQSSPRYWYGLCEGTTARLDTFPPMVAVTDDMIERRRRAARRAERRGVLLRYRYGNKHMVWTFDTSGYRLLDARANRIKAELARIESQARMEAAAEACVVATEAAVEAWRAVA